MEKILDWKSSSPLERVVVSKLEDFKISKIIWQSANYCIICFSIHHSAVEIKWFSKENCSLLWNTEWIHMKSVLWNLPHFYGNHFNFLELLLYYENYHSPVKITVVPQKSFQVCGNTHKSVVIIYVSSFLSQRSVVKY